MEVTKHTLKYIGFNPTQGILVNVEPSYKLTTYCDSDWASCP